MVCSLLHGRTDEAPVPRSPPAISVTESRSPSPYPTFPQPASSTRNPSAASSPSASLRMQEGAASRESLSPVYQQHSPGKRAHHTTEAESLPSVPTTGSIPPGKAKKAKPNPAASKSKSDLVGKLVQLLNPYFKQNCFESKVSPSEQLSVFCVLLQFPANWM